MVGNASKERSCARLQYRISLVGPALQQKGGMASVQKLILKEMPDDFVAEHISTHDEGSLGHRFRIFAAATLVLARRLLFNQVDLVHLHVSEKGSVLRNIILLLLVKGFRRPVVMHAHGCEFHTFHAGLGRIARSLVNRALQQADCFVTLSEGWRAYYIRHCNLDKSKVVTLPNPVELPPAVPERSLAATVNFAFLGRIGQRKGAFDLIRAFAAMPNRDRARLWLAGDGDIAAAAALIAELGLSDTVHLLGWIGEEQRTEVLAAAHAFVLPSYNEALPMAMLEAMAAALPIVATPVGGIAEFVTDGKEGYLVEPGDIEALSRSLNRLVVNEGQRRAMGRRARDRVRPLDLKCYSQQLSTLYRLLLDSRRSKSRYSPEISLKRALSNELRSHPSTKDCEALEAARVGEPSTANRDWPPFATSSTRSSKR